MNIRARHQNAQITMQLRDTRATTLFMHVQALKLLSKKDYRGMLDDRNTREVVKL